MYKIAYFSPTGNTKFLAVELSKYLNLTDELFNIAGSQKLDFDNIDNIVIMYSIHAFSTPKKVLNFVKSIPNEFVKNVSILAVGCTTATINQGSSLKVRQILKKKGITVVVDEVIQMPLTIVTTLSDVKNKEIVRDASSYIKEVAQRIINHDVSKKNVPIWVKMISPIGSIEKGAAKLFGLELHASKLCTSCGVCWSSCPTENITKSKNNKPKFHLKCIMCLKCIYDCPVHAIKPRISKFIPIKNGYQISNYLQEETDEYC